MCTRLLLALTVTASTLLAGPAPGARQPRSIPQFGLHEVTLEASGRYSNPYAELAAEASLIGPDGRMRALPLFWDGGATWRFRFTPDVAGEWRWTVVSRDPGLNGKSGSFAVAPSRRRGGIRPMRGHPAHFERQDGSPFWFLGDTAWAFFTDSSEERHDREAALRYADARAAQGFNVIHSMVLSEAGWANRGGAPFSDISAERLNPMYWQEIDARIAYANSKGLVCGLAIAWGDKRREEPYAWRRFPTVEARQRYARYAAARYGAYDVFFLVSGEWHAEITTRPAPEADVKREFMQIGDVLAAADPHDRMIAIHPMADHGSVREFNAASWMAFGDYQQNYRELHARALLSRRSSKPVVNSEYGYYLRDQNGDGVPDKDNSTSLESMRHATWDILMAGAYAVTGFGTTYFGGHRDPGPFDVDAAKNTEWERQVGVLARFFTNLEWWKLEPQDELLRSPAPRGPDTRHLQRLAPPAAAYWALAEPGRQYVVYVRGLQEPVTVALPAGGGLRARQFDPRTGAFSDLSPASGRDGFVYRPPDRQDWVVLLNAEQPVNRPQ
jgi:hypothetical protein